MTTEGCTLTCAAAQCRTGDACDQPTPADVLRKRQTAKRESAVVNKMSGILGHLTWSTSTTTLQLAGVFWGIEGARAVAEGMRSCANLTSLDLSGTCFSVGV
jgi:hypothetical protein